MGDQKKVLGLFGTHIIFAKQMPIIIMNTEMPKGNMWSSVPLPQLLLNLCVFI